MRASMLPQTQTQIHKQNKKQIHQHTSRQKKIQPQNNPEKKYEYDVMGVGNLLMDLLVETHEGILQQLQLRKGEFHLTEEQQIQKIFHLLEQQGLAIEEVPGGSSANTIRGVAFLGATAALCGKLGNDSFGEKYHRELLHLGVTPLTAFSNEKTTGHALTFITPDAQRTFSVHLGAAQHLSREDVTEEDIKKAKLLHLEGYLFEGTTQAAALHVIRLAKKNNTKISLDLADPGVVRRNKELFSHLLAEEVDIIFTNEEEAKAYTGGNTRDEVSAILAQQVPLAIIKYGVEGSLLLQQGKRIFVPAFAVQALDTTGAGDCYAAGFLYGWCNNWDLIKASLLGSLFAAKIVQKKGVRIDMLSREEIFKELEEAHERMTFGEPYQKW